MLDYLSLFIGNNLRYAIALVFAYFSVLGFADWIRDVKFYRRNGWNFDLQSNSKFKQAIGSDVPVPNKARVYFLAPIFVTLMTIGSLIFAFGSTSPR